MTKLILSLTLTTVTVAVTLGAVFARTAPSTSPPGLPKGIVFYGKLKDGLREARETNRPILFLAAAPQCAGVPGMW